MTGPTPPPEPPLAPAPGGPALPPRHTHLTRYSPAGESPFPLHPALVPGPPITPEAVPSALAVPPPPPTPPGPPAAAGRPGPRNRRWAQPAGLVLRLTPGGPSANVHWSGNPGASTPWAGSGWV